MDRCWKVIDKQTEQAVESDGFATIERSLLEAVIVRDTLSIKEVNLFKAVNLWVTNECERQGLTTRRRNQKKNSWRIDRQRNTLSSDETR